jgi:hypothetical protein
VIYSRELAAKWKWKAITSLTDRDATEERTRRGERTLATSWMATILQTARYREWGIDLDFDLFFLIKILFYYYLYFIFFNHYYFAPFSIIFFVFTSWIFTPIWRVSC